MYWQEILLERMALGCYFSEKKVDKYRIIKCNSGSVNKAMTVLNIVFAKWTLSHNVLKIGNVELDCYYV